VIEFLCPNGHRISCPADQAGQAAKCPRCAVRFRIPEHAEPISPDVDTANDVKIVVPGEPRPEIAAIPPDRGETAPVSEPQIEFLCPQGHRLHGPRSLQGQPGECPECESKFRIPTFDDEPGEVEPKEDAPSPTATATPSSRPELPAIAQPTARTGDNSPAPAGHALLETVGRETAGHYGETLPNRWRDTDPQSVRRIAFPAEPRRLCSRRTGRNPHANRRGMGVGRAGRSSGRETITGGNDGIEGDVIGRKK
jgi:hypothetical protein